jgi:hypothetical protein
MKARVDRQLFRRRRRHFPPASARTIRLRDYCLDGNVRRGDQRAQSWQRKFRGAAKNYAERHGGITNPRLFSIFGFCA